MIDRAHTRGDPPGDVTRTVSGVGVLHASPIADAVLALMRRIDELRLALPFAGSRMLRDLLNDDGVVVGREHVRTLMRQMGHRDLSAPEGYAAAPRASRLSLSAPHAHNHAAESRLRGRYDLHLRGARLRASGRHRGLGEPQNAHLGRVADAHKRLLRRGARRSTRPLRQAAIFNTDQDGQYTNTEFLNVLRRRQVAISMDGTGCRRDNVFVEHLRHSAKYEEVHLRGYETISDVRVGLTRHFQFFSHRRPPGGLALERFGSPGPLNSAGTRALPRMAVFRVASGSTDWVAAAPSPSPA
jgi:putative transposase